MFNFLIRKINNQFLKIEKLIKNRKQALFKKKLQSCGQHVHIGFPVKFEGINYITIGNNVSINSFVHIWGHGGVHIGDNTLIASHVAIVSVTHDSNAILFNRSTIEKKTVIGNNVWIGAHSVILPGISIGDNVIVGAGSVVTKNLESNGVYVGAPAKRIKELTQFHNTHINRKDDIT